jgi:hexosaminidase
MAGRWHIFIVAFLLISTGCSRQPDRQQQETIVTRVVPVSIIPTPKQQTLSREALALKNTLHFYAEQEALNPLQEVLRDELLSLYGLDLEQAGSPAAADLIVALDPLLGQEEYQVEVKEQTRVAGGSYKAIAMGTVSMLQSISRQGETIYIPKGTIRDAPDLPFRGFMVDVARREHDVEVLKQLVSLCRWYKINYMQLHLTDEKYFTFPSGAYPQLMGQGFHFTREELLDLVAFADARGVELIPELEVPGHAGQFVEQMPELFGFQDKSLNKFTINMAREDIYPVLDTLVGEIAAVFHSSSYIHIGGDEANFSGMGEDPEVRQYLQENNLASVEELYWQFINRMNEFVKKRGRKTIVWEGFSKEANPVISKDITVMAWETMYQMPDDLLDAGFRIINVSWKPLYIVNDKKWSTKSIYNWNVYNWQNWVPHIPSYNPIQLEEHPHVLGASMASWDQPAYVEVSSTRLRLPAMAERVWNKQQVVPYADFATKLQQLDNKLNRYFSPVTVQEEGLRYPEISDGRKEEQTWFGDTLYVKLAAPEGYTLRYSTDGARVDYASNTYTKPVKLYTTTTLKYRAYDSDGKHVGHEMLKYYELNPLEVTLSGNTVIDMDTLWETLHSWYIPMADSMQVSITPLRKGLVRYIMGDKPLNKQSNLYQKPFTVKEDALMKAGLFIGDSLTGEPWTQHFRTGRTD